MSTASVTVQRIQIPATIERQRIAAPVTFAPDERVSIPATVNQVAQTLEAELPQVVQVETAADVVTQVMQLEVERAQPLNVAIDVQVGLKGDPGPAGDFFERAGIDHTRNRTNGLITSLSYTDGYVLTFNRNPDDTLANLTGSDGKVKTFTRDGDGNLLSVAFTTP